MAIVQISQITNRKGLQTDLPQLAGAELGWSVDSRRLFIGNGTLEEGAPVIGNTEILTEFSDILAFGTNYTYKGQAAGYTVQTGSTPSSPVQQSLQSWLDQFATVKDFGAVGDGIADDTAAINRALYQLFCREANTQIRRGLFFPAGTYRVTSTILIPPYAMLYGEGRNSSIIQLDAATGTPYVARTADTNQNVGPNIGTGGATPPQFITISNLGFKNLDSSTDVFLIEYARDCYFQNVEFNGPYNISTLTTGLPATAGVKFASTPSLVCSDIIMDGCVFSGTIYGLYSTTYNTESGGVVSEQIKGLTVSNSKFNLLLQGIYLDNTATSPIGPGATGVRIVGNVFDNIYAEGIIFGQVNLNASGHNIFYDVGNHFNGVTNPQTAIIDIQNNDNVSISDLFQRADQYSTTWPRINLNATTSIGITNSSQLAIGQFVIGTGTIVTLADNTASPTPAITIDVTNISALTINYTIVRDTSYRTGTLTILTNGSTNDLYYSDDYSQNETTGIGLTVTQSLDSNIVNINYTSTPDSGLTASMTYSITHLA